MQNIDKRSNQLNRYFHLVVGKIAKHTGYTPAETKNLLKVEFNQFKEFANKRTGQVIIEYFETSKMTNKQLSDFLNDIILLANSTLGMNILEPSEYYDMISDKKTAEFIENSKNALQQ